MGRTLARDCDDTEGRRGVDGKKNRGWEKRKVKERKKGSKTGSKTGNKKGK